MLDKQLLTTTVQQALEGTDCFLVDVTITPANNVTVEIDSPAGVDIDTCANLTRTIEQAFDRDVEDYDLEVGSAGLTAPFKVKGQFDKNIGNEVEVLTKDGKKLRGTLVGVNADASQFTIEMQVKRKEPGKKKPVVATEPLTLATADTKYVKYSFNFK